MSDHAELLAAACQWLRYQRRCVIIATERSVYPWGRPDVLGVNTKRQTTEIEIKVTMADFRKNAEKRCIQNRERHGLYRPRQFYFAVPPHLADKCAAELPSYAGLLTLSDVYQFQPNRLATVVKPSPVFPEPPLSFMQITHMVRHMSGTLCRQYGALFAATKQPEAVQ